MYKLLSIFPSWDCHQRSTEKIIFISAVIFLTLICSVSANATFLPVNATPPVIQEPNGEKLIADTAKLSGYSDWNPALSKTLTAYEFTTANNWLYNTAPSPCAPAPTPCNNPVSLGANAKFDVTNYTLESYEFDGKNAIIEKMQFSLTEATASPKPNHWLQLINTNLPTGRQIQGFSGNWFLDNGPLPWKPGIGPFYDSNSTPKIVPNNFLDIAQQISPNHSYAHFWTIPSWDVALNEKDYIIVSNQAVNWGWMEISEPATFSLVCIGMAGIAFGKRRKSA